MILETLNDLYDRLAGDPGYGVPTPGRSTQKITFKVVIRPDGSLVAIEDVRVQDGGRLVPRQLQVLGNTKPSGQGINPCFLWDNSQYMLGVKADDEKPDRTRRAFEAFRQRHLEAEAEIGDPAFSAVCRFLEWWVPEEHASNPALNEAAATGFGVFQIAGETQYAHEVPAVKAWWSRQVLGKPGPEGECLVTGRVAPLARTHDKIRGVVGAQGAGGTIVGFNDPAYESYGKLQSFNAPVAQDVAFRYVAALNALLDGPRKDRHRVLLGDMTVAFWTEQPTSAEDFFVQFAASGSRALRDQEAQDPYRIRQLSALLRALRGGREAYREIDFDPEKTPYYILGLSPNSARISVRLFLRGTVADLLDKLRLHFDHIGLPWRPGGGRRREDPEFPSFLNLLDQTARERKDIPPLLAAPLVRAVLEGGSYPLALYTAVLRRIAADRRVDYLRGCVIKGYLNRNLKHEVTMALDRGRPDPPYRLGRLFAALEKTQKDALGVNLNKTIRDSFYGAASATPRSVFPRILRTYQHHLAKLDAGHRIHRERLVQEILSPIQEFPAHLDLAGQGLFAIGYYHQNDDFYTKRDGTAAINEPAALNGD
jgi:CRISPR-associated protein Csd1